MKSSANQDLKASMFENVFGYEKKASQQEESKGGNLPTQSVSMPIVAAGYDS